MVFNSHQLKEKYLKLFKEKITYLQKKTQSVPSLAVILIGEDPASLSYIRSKEKTCRELGINFSLHQFSHDISEEDILKCISSLNRDNNISGIIVQLPLPKHLSQRRVLNSLFYQKDVDGLSDMSLGSLVSGDSQFIPCTPLGILRIFRDFKIETESKHVVIIGRSSLVGRPLSILLSAKPYNATVSLCHTKTKYIDIYTKMADILIVAAGDPHLIKGHMVSRGCVVIDVGISRKEGRLIGDVNFEEVSQKVDFITPVPGGVGVMTVLMLMHNTIKASFLQKNLLWESNF